MQAQISLLTSLLLAALPVGAQAQSVWSHVIEKERVNGPIREPARTTVAGLTVATPDDRAALQRVGEKSPVLAGALSFVVPGVGSFYAGHTGHGIRHLVAVPVVVGGTVLGLVIANQDSGEFETAEAFVLLAGAAALLVNGVWSVVTAVSDANAYNRKITVGQLEIQPVVRLLDQSQLGIEVARVRF